MPDAELTLTSASRVRLRHARDIALACPPSLYDEIALTGSPARGFATPESDIEINFWVRDLPAIEARREWVESLGATQIVAHTDPRPDDSYWVNALYNGIELEAGWQTFGALDTALTQLMEARTTDHKALRLAELVLSAKNLRGNGALEKWQPALQNYPQDLAHKLISEALTEWVKPDWLDKSRPENHPYKDDIHRIWRVIFALNHEWEINWKHAHYSVPHLAIVPVNIAGRIEQIKSAPPAQSSKYLLQLIRDTLKLIKTNFGDQLLLADNLTHTHALLEQLP